MSTIPEVFTRDKKGFMGLLCDRSCDLTGNWTLRAGHFKEGELKAGTRLTLWDRPCWLLLPGWTAAVCCGRPLNPPPLDDVSTPQTHRTWNCSYRKKMFRGSIKDRPFILKYKLHLKAAPLITIVISPGIHCWKSSNEVTEWLGQGFFDIPAVNGARVRLKRLPACFIERKGFFCRTHTHLR